MKNKILIILLVLVAFSLPACTKKSADNYLMDELAPDNKYHYSNKDLGFSLSLPEQFIYYQTQRRNFDGYTIVEFFVPTNDLEYPQEVPSYGKFFSTMIYDKGIYEGMDKIEKDSYIYFGEKSDKAYLGLFWEEAPSDWQDRWSLEVRDEIENSYQILK